jgi:uncharacterized membrane protein
MRIKMGQNVIIEKLNHKFWIIPSLIVVLVIGILMLSLQVPNDSLGSMLMGYSPQGARLILSTVGTSLMTVIGVLCSLTILVLQQVSSQYSPRVIENYTKSFATRFIVGMYIGTFLYCILLLRLMPPPSLEADLPQAAITIAIVLAMICTGLLIHYINNIANSVKSINIIQNIKEESLNYLKSFETFVKERSYTYVPLDIPGGNIYQLKSEQAGYFQSFSPEKLSEVLCGRFGEVSFSRIPGDYLFLGETLAEIRTKDKMSDDLIKEIRATIQIGVSRSHVQDMRYGVRQLVDIALRGLSPGINDPTTAVECLNSIGSLLQKCNEIGRSTDYLKIEDVIIRLPRVSFQELIELSLFEILKWGKDHRPIGMRINEILRMLEEEAVDQGNLYFCQRMRGVVNAYEDKQVYHGLQ